MKIYSVAVPGHSTLKPEDGGAFNYMFGFVSTSHPEHIYYRIVPLENKLTSGECLKYVLDQ